MLKRKLSDYTPEEMTRFQKMESDVQALNEKVASGGDVVEPLPYSREEIGELSRYQQLALVERLRDVEV